MVLTAIFSAQICSENGLKSANMNSKFCPPSCEIRASRLVTSFSHSRRWNPQIYVDSALQVSLHHSHPENFTSCYINPFMTQRNIHIYKNRCLYKHCQGVRSSCVTLIAMQMSHVTNSDESNQIFISWAFAYPWILTKQDCYR